MAATIDYIDIYLHGNSITDSVLTEPLELFFQELELAIQIGPGEIWGVAQSINLKRYLFNQYVTLSQIKNEIKNYIVNNCEHATYFDYSIEAENLKIDNKDLIYIVINVSAIDQNNQPQTFKQKFLLGT